MSTPCIILTPSFKLTGTVDSRIKGSLNISNPVKIVSSRLVTISATITDINDAPISRKAYLFNNHSFGNFIASGTSDAITGVIVLAVPGVPNSTKFSILVDAEGADVNHVVYSQVTGV